MLVGVALAAKVVGVHLSSGDPLVAALAGVGWVLLVSVYLVTFWSLTGHTPGMRFMGIKVIDRTGAALGQMQSLRRLVGMGLAALPAGAGFLLVLVDDRRRGLQDLIGSTLVIHDPVTARASAPVPESGATPAAADHGERVELVHGDGGAALGGHAQRLGRVPAPLEAVQRSQSAVRLAGRRCCLLITAIAPHASASAGGTSWGSAETRTTAEALCASVMHRAAATPPRPGMRTSIRTRSGRSAAASVTACSPDVASPTASKPGVDSISRRAATRNGGWSSTTSTPTVLRGGG